MAMNTATDTTDIPIKGVGMKRTLLITALFLGMGLMGCASAHKQALHHVSDMVDERSNQPVDWRTILPDSGKQAAPPSLPGKKLSSDDVVQEALQRNAEVKAIYRRLGIAYGEFVEAGLLENPEFEGAVRFPDEESGTNVELELRQNIISMVTWPFRKRMAKDQFKSDQMEVAHDLFDFIIETKKAYYDLAGSQAMFERQEAIMQLAEAARELAERQHAAGNINALDLSEHNDTFYKMKLEYVEKSLALRRDRENLSQLLGMGGQETDWEIAAAFSELPPGEAQLKNLQDAAFEQRLDLLVLQKQLAALKSQHWAARLKVIPFLGAGVATEKEADGEYLTGPAFSAEVPIFDRNQGERIRVRNMTEEIESRIKALENTIRSEIRILHDELLTARWQIDYYRNKILPNHEKNLHATQLHYNFMLTGVYHLLEAKQEELDAYREYIHSQKEYWSKRAELERAVGGALPDDFSVVTTEAIKLKPKEDPDPMTAHQHHNH